MRGHQPVTLLAKQRSDAAKFLGRVHLSVTDRVRMGAAVHRLPAVIDRPCAPAHRFPQGSEPHRGGELSGIYPAARGQHRNGTFPDVDDRRNGSGVARLTVMHRREVRVLDGHCPQGAMRIGVSTEQAWGKDRTTPKDKK